MKNMKKTIYLPARAKKQLETSDDARIWATPLPYKEKAQADFTCKIYLDKRDLENPDVIKDGIFHPARASSIDDILERIEMVEVKKAEVEKNGEELHRLVNITRGPAGTGASKKGKSVLKDESAAGAIYRCFHGAGDDECWAQYAPDPGNPGSGSVDILLRHSFSIYSPDSYFRSKERMLESILKSACGVVINRQEVDLPDAFDGYSSLSSICRSLFAFAPTDVVSDDSRTYKIFAHHDGGRGYALFLIKHGKRIDHYLEDHIDTVRDKMLSEKFLKDNSLKVDLKYLLRSDADCTQYEPTAEDFEKGFHVDEKGRRKKA